VDFVIPIFKAFNSPSQKEKKEFMSDSGYHAGVGYIPFIIEECYQLIWVCSRKFIKSNFYFILIFSRF